MSSLFGLAGEYKQLYAMLTDADEDEKQTVEDTLEAVKGEIQVKASGYLAVLNQIDMELEGAKKQKEFWSNKVKTWENAQKRLKQHFLDGMLMLGVDEIDADGVKIKVANAGGVLPIVYDEDKPVPDKFTKVTIETDGKLVREALNRGEKLDFAHFGERGKTLRFK